MLSLYLLPALCTLPSLIFAAPFSETGTFPSLSRRDAPAAECNPIGSGIPYTICTPSGVTNASLVKGNNIWGGITIQDNVPNGAASSNRYIVLYEDINEEVSRPDVEVSVYGGSGVELSIQNGESFSQTWTIGADASFTAEEVGATLSFSYSETYTFSTQQSITCTVTDAVGVMVVQPVVNHRGGWAYVTDNLQYIGGSTDVIHSVTRWDTDIPSPSNQGFVQGVYKCCGGAALPFPCCEGNCEHTGA